MRNLSSRIRPKGRRLMSQHFSVFARLGTLMSMLVIPAICPAATVLFSNFGSGSSYDTSQGNPVGNAFDGNDYAEGDTFVLTGDAKFSSLSIALSCFATCKDPFTVSLTKDAGDQPGTTIESFTVAPGSLKTLGANNPPLLLHSVLDPKLTGGTRYWITVKADLNDSIDWNLNSTGDTADEAISLDDGSTWFSPSGNTPGAFAISATIPEPGSIGLLLSSGLLFGLVRRVRGLK